MDVRTEESSNPLIEHIPDLLTCFAVKNIRVDWRMKRRSDATQKMCIDLLPIVEFWIFHLFIAWINLKTDTV